MSQDIWNTVDPTTTSGTQLADYLNDFKDAMVSGLSGTSRPANLQSGGYWIDTTNDGLGYWSYKMYNGTSDIEIFQINRNTGGLILGSSEESITIIKQTDDAFGPKLKLEKERLTGTQTQANDVLGDIEFIGNDSSGIEYVQAKISSVSLDGVTNAAQGADVRFYITESNGTALVEAMRLTDDGKLGVGTDSPDKDIHVSGTTSTAGVKATMIAANADGVDFVSTKIRVANSGQILINDMLGSHKFESTDDAGTTFEAGKLEVSATENHTASNRGTKVTIDNIVAGEAALSNAISIEDDVTVDRKLIVTGDLEVQGTSTTIETATLDIEDANITVNKGGTQVTADAQDAGFTVEMSDATDAQIGYDSTLASKFKVGEIGTEKEIVDVSSVQDVSNKAIIDPSRSDVKKDTEANLTTYAATATDGQLCFATDTLSAYVIYDNTLQAIGGGGQGGINYVTNPDAEKGLDGVSVTGTIPLTLETTTPLFGTQSFTVISTGGDYAGDIIVIDIDTIDEANKYNSMSGNLWVRNKVLSAGEMLLKIYDVTNAQYVSLTSGSEIGATLTGDFAHPFSFMATDSVEYKAHLVVNTTDTDAFIFAWDNIEVGPAAPAVIGAPVTDWKSFTPTGSWTTNVAYTGKYRRIGDSAEIQVNIAISASPLPAYNLVVDFSEIGAIDSTKINSTTLLTSVFGVASILNNGIKVYTGSVSYSSATDVYVSTADDASGNSILTPTLPFAFAASDSVNISFRVPIAGWSSGVQMSETTSNRFISAKISQSNAYSYSATTGVIKYQVSENDTTNSYDPVTGFFTVPENGYYDIHASNQVSYTGAFWTLSIRKGGIILRNGDYNTPTDANKTVITLGEYLEKGDEISIYLQYIGGGAGVATPGDPTGASHDFFSVTKSNTGTQTIAQSETVAAKYRISPSSSNLSFATGAYEVIDYDTKDYDTHNAVTTGTSWRFTAPIAGIYRVAARFQFGDSVGQWNGTNEYYGLEIYKNGVVNTTTTQRRPRAAELYVDVLGSTPIKLETGDYIDLQIYQNSGVALPPITNATTNLSYVSIERIK